MVGSTAFAVADEESSNPAVNTNECALVDGVFAQTGRGNAMVRTCTVGGGEDTLLEGQPAGDHPVKQWTVDVLVPAATTVYRFQPSVGFSETSTGSGDPQVVACYNHQDNEVEDFEDNPHCQLAAGA